MIELGDKVKSKYSGFTGVVISKTSWINGCTQFGIVPKCDKNNKNPECEDIDEASLEIISKGKLIKQDEDGGPNRRGIRLKGY